MFDSILTASGGSVTALNVVSLLLVSLACGLLIALTAHLSGRISQSFSVSLLVMPVIVMGVVMVVNGNLGAGVAAMGAFSLVRFRSVAGNAREISLIFLAMAAGLATGMGYLLWAVVMVIAVALLLLLADRIKLRPVPVMDRILRITISEDLDYAGLFDQTLAAYTKTFSLEGVRTTGMGSLFDLTYHITLKDAAREKTMLDEIRALNGNLPIVCAHHASKEQL